MSTLYKYKVIGIMSGTSMDGLDCSYIKTDGKDFVSIIFENSYKFSVNYRNKLQKTIQLQAKYRSRPNAIQVQAKYAGSGCNAKKLRLTCNNY